MCIYEINGVKVHGSWFNWFYKTTERIPHIRKMFNRNVISSKENQPTMDMQMKQDSIQIKFGMSYYF